jgi:membrane-bound serine protease (ClpP class)
VVYVAPIEGMIDLGVAPFIQRVLNDATRQRGAAVILEINTFGGRVDAAAIIQDVAQCPGADGCLYKQARISAGALISMAAEKIVMANGATMGAATPVQTGQPGARAQPVEEKGFLCAKGVSRNGGGA